MKIDFKTQRYICTILFAMLFVFNLYFCLAIYENASPLSWICVGWCAGLFVASLFSNSSQSMNEDLMNLQDKIIHSLRNSIDDYSNIITKLNEEYSKKSTKGGKKKK